MSVGHGDFRRVLNGGLFVVVGIGLLLWGGFVREGFTREGVGVEGVEDEIAGGDAERVEGFVIVRRGGVDFVFSVEGEMERRRG
jgi:hypothetical protein